MEKANGFSNVSNSALENVGIRELLGLCDADWIKEGIKDYGLSGERNRIINALFVQPVLGCLKAGYSEEEVRDFPNWVRPILAKCDRVTDPLERIERLGITDSTEEFQAIEMFKNNKTFLQLELSSYAEAERVLTYAPGWAITDKQKIEFVRTVYRACMQDWYLRALSRMSEDDLTYVKRKLQQHDKDCLAILALRCLPRSAAQILNYSDVYWISICFGKSVFRVPVYFWEFLQNILGEELKGVEFKYKDGTLFVCDSACSSRLLPINKYSDTEHPIEDFGNKVFNALGLEGTPDAIQTIQIYNLSCAVADGQLTWNEVRSKLIGGNDEMV